MAVARETVRAANLPPREAIEFFAGKANVTTTHWTDVWRTGHARGFMVAGAASEAIVDDFRQAVTKALEQGTTLAEFRKDFDGIVSRHGWVHNGTAAWRARLIYDVNLSMAYSAGRWDQQTRPENLAAFPYLQYVHSGAAHPRKQHLAWNGLVLAADDAFWQTHYPPNGWRCGCRARSRSGRDLVRMGKQGPDRAPAIETRRWTNPRTGVTSDVPIGIDPGFDYNVGAAWRGNSIPAIPTRAAWTAPPGWVPPAPPLPAARPAPPPRPAGPEPEPPTIRLAPDGPDAPGEVPLPPMSPEEQARVERLLVPLRQQLRRLLGDAVAERERDASVARIRDLLRSEMRRRTLLARLRREQGDAAAEAARDLDAVELLLRLEQPPPATPPRRPRRR